MTGVQAHPAAGRAPVPVAAHSTGEQLTALRPAHLLLPQPPMAAAPPISSLFSRPVLVSGCHGGAGATTLAQLVGAYDIGVWRPQPTAYPVVLVARGTVQGATRATWSVRTSLAAGVMPAAVVIVADGPWPEPRLARLRLHLLSGLVPALVRLPFVTAWRYLDEPARHPPARVRRALDRLCMALQPNHPRR
jgi:hypothetical protein